MSVSNTNLRSPATGGYACNGSTTDFAGTFNLLAEGDVDVILADSSGNESTLVLTTDYTVAPTGGSYPCTAFTITTVSTYASGNTITLKRSMDLTQPTAYGNAGPYYPNTHETSYDRLLLQVQQQQEELDRCVKYKASTDTTGATFVLDTDGSVILSYLQNDSVTTDIIADNAVTYAKIQQVSATDKILGRSTAGAGNVEEIACTAAGRALIDDANASAQRTTLGLGDSATKNVGTAAGTVCAGDDSRLALAASGLSTSEMLYVREEQTSGTDGGGFTSGAWRTRTLNTEKVNTITGASLATNQVTLPAGDYIAIASAPAYRVDRHKIKLANITDASDVEIGTSEISPAPTFPSTRSFLSTQVFTLADTKVLELQHQCAATKATDGLGLASSFSVVEVYAELIIYKVG